MTTEADVNTRLTRLETSHEHLATKEDIANLRTDMANLRTEMADLRTEMAKEMANMKADLIRWMVGSVIAGLTAAVGLTALILRILGPWT
jgi:hypothetical protein